MSQRVAVEIQDDFLQRQSRAKPIQAISELIWNGLDADAKNVSVEFSGSDLSGRYTKIVIYDDGTGFPSRQAKELFGKLGGSWKRQTRRTVGLNRMVHGQEGRGRYKALSLGSTAIWKVVHEGSGSKDYFEIRMLEEDIKEIEIEQNLIENAAFSVGVTLEISNIKADSGVFTSETGIQELTETFALYLINYSDVSISIGGIQLDPQSIISNKVEFDLDEIEGEDGEIHPVKLQLIEWKRPTGSNLYLCNEEGFPFDQVQTKFHTGPFSFSAYLKSRYVTSLHNSSLLGLSDMDQKLTQAVDSAKSEIKDFFREKTADHAKNAVEKWKEEDVYPYEGESRDPIEIAERQVFDIVAVNVQNWSPDLANAPKTTKELHLRMLRHAIESSPSELQVILNEVLQLKPRKRKELADLLQETTLSSIITAAKTVSDRLKFITGLEAIVFDPEKRDRLKERSQLHKILAENTWVFGEEYNLWVNDGDLKRVLQKHSDKLGDGALIDEPVKVVGKKRGIVDLMFSRASC